MLDVLKIPDLGSSKISFLFRLAVNLLTDPEIRQGDDNGLETDTAEGKY